MIVSTFHFLSFIMPSYADAVGRVYHQLWLGNTASRWELNGISGESPGELVL